MSENRPTTQSESANKSNKDISLERPQRWMLLLIGFTMAIWIIALPGYLIIQQGSWQYTPTVIISALCIPVYILLLYAGRVFLYIYWRFYWWFITCQFIFFAIMSIAIIVGMVTGSIALSDLLRI